MGNRLFGAALGACLLLAGAAPVQAGATVRDDTLAAALAELRALEGTERRMREEYRELAARGALSASERRDFEAYLARLEADVKEQRETVSRLEAARDKGVAAAEAATKPTDSPAFGQGETDAERVANMDAELGSSLSDFDQMLLREQQELARKEKARTAGTDSRSSAEGRQGTAGDASAEGAESSGEEDSQGVGEPSEGSGESASTETGEEGAQGSADEEAASEKGGDRSTGEDQVAAAKDSEAGGVSKDKSAVPADIPDGKDDDIVARQLREAAEKEQDPELREKLWDEYRKYKRKNP